MKKVHHIVTLLMALVLVLSTFMGQAQTPISLNEAVNKAISYYPTIKAAKMDVTSAQVAKNAAWDYGETEFSVSAEEIGRGNKPTWKLLTVRQNFDLLGKKQYRNYHGQREVMSKANVDLAELDLKREVSVDYATAYVAFLRLHVYEHIDSLCREFQRAAKLRYDTQETSRLEYVSATNQVQQAALNVQKAKHDCEIAVDNLNRWIGPDANFVPDESLQQLLPTVATGVGTHPSVALAQEKVKLSESEIELEKSEYRPKFYAEYSAQMVDGKAGYHAFQVGVSVPIFSAKSSKEKMAQINRDVAKQEMIAQEIETNNARNTLAATADKWWQSVSYYRTTALPVAQEQKKAAWLAYSEGASEYVDFIQNLNETTQVELDYLDAFAEYLQARLQLDYYITK